MKARFKYVKCKYCSNYVGAGSFKPVDHKILSAKCPKCCKKLFVDLDGNYI